jgi:hypothetical protein
LEKHLLSRSTTTERDIGAKYQAAVRERMADGGIKHKENA